VAQQVTKVQKWTNAFHFQLCLEHVQLCLKRIPTMVESP